ncbi:hypothetical protein ACG2F4_06805 [Halalkalibaculum sp. DA3122]|uniref:AbiU2 domain-containing protein n=1 Tax=Halalkalibaculum sp. DA3122 TaxID=3373607 RepID=UPI0037545F6A
MGSQLTAEEIKQKFVKSYPQDSGLLAYYLWNDIAHLHQNWKNYRIFYGTDQETIELLNELAPSFFNSLQRILRHEIILSIGRLTDPPYSGRNRKKENASIKKLLEEVTSTLDSDVEKELQKELKKLKKQTSKIRDLRNQIIAHSDLPTRLELRSDPLPGISRAEIEETLVTIRKIFTKIEKEFTGSTSYFEGVVTTDDANSIIGYLKTARKYHEEEYKRLKGIE